MKKSLLIKLGKITLVFVAVCFISLIVWANWDETTYTQQNTPTAVYKTYDISKVDPGQYGQIEKRISLLDGVTACSLNSVDKLVGIMFLTSKVSDAELQSKLNVLLGSAVTERSFGSKSGGCPVTGVKYMVLHVRDLFRFRS